MQHRRMKGLQCLMLAFLMLFLCAGAPPAVGAEKAPLTNIAAEAEDVVRIWLTKPAVTTQVQLRTTGYYAVDALGVTLAPDTTVDITLAGEQMMLHYAGVTLALGQQVFLRRKAAPSVAAGCLYLGSNEARFEGDLQLDVIEGVIRPILHIDVETYLLGVVPYEMSDSFPLEALKAQAVAARTYALRKRNASRDYDMTDNTNDQVFYGTKDTYKNAAQAIAQTAGICGYYKGKLAICYYAASNGGQTELIDNVWAADGEDHKYVDVRDDPYDLENIRSVVKKYTIPKKPGTAGVGEALHEALVAQIAPQIEKEGYDPNAQNVQIVQVHAVTLDKPKGEPNSRLYTQIAFEVTLAVRKVLPQEEAEEEGTNDTPRPDPTPEAATNGGQVPFDVAATLTPEPTATPRPVNLGEYETMKEPTVITLSIFEGAEAAMALSISHMSNELWTVRTTSEDFVIEARRYGHGVGMSQRGAEWMALRYEKTYEEILAFYYPGLEFRTAQVSSSTPEPLDPLVLATPMPSPSPTPRPTLMPLTGIVPQGAYVARVTNIEEDSSLNLRKEPSTESDVRMRLLKDQLLLVLEEDENGWAKVRTDVIEGYVMREYLEKE